MRQRSRNTNITNARESENHKKLYCREAIKKHRKERFNMRTNNHFEERKNVFPMNLQLFADGGAENHDGDSKNDNGNQTSQKGSTNQDEKNGEQDKLNHDDLVAELARMRAEATQAQADRDRYKNSIDDLTKKNKALTEQVRATMTAEQQIDAAKKEAEEAREKELNDIRTELATIRATKRYMTIKMDEKVAEETAKAEIAGDMEKVIANMATHINELEKKSAEDAINKFLADRPDIKAGNGNAEKQSLAEEKAKEFVSRKPTTVNSDALKRFM